MTRFPTFDQHERERIRYTLLNYKIAQGMGAPELAKRISEANLNHPKVNQRRVSRFLAKQHDPENMFVAWCDTFLQSVPVPPDPIWQLAKALLGFCAEGAKFDFSGNYILRNENIHQPPVSAKLRATADDGFWRLEERSNQDNAIWDGVFINTNTGGLAILKERLVSVTKTYSIRICDDNTIMGGTMWFNHAHNIRGYMFFLEKIL